MNDVTQIISGAAPHALVVDDDALILADATAILEDAGFQVLEAMNVAQALDVLERHHVAVHLLFTDVQMPGDENGFDLARRTSERWPHIAVVVASGRAAPEPGDLPEGATFICKPFSAEIVRQHVRESMPDEKQPRLLKE